MLDQFNSKERITISWFVPPDKVSSDLQSSNESPLAELLTSLLEQGFIIEMEQKMGPGIVCVLEKERIVNR